MSQFSFDATAGASQSTAKPRLEGNAIYNVKLDECEVQDIQGVKDATKVYKVIKFKFSNEDGSYEHTIFEPDEDRGDFKRTETEFTNKNGNIEKIPQPSAIESMMLFFKHVIDAFVPEVAKLIDDGTKKLAAPNWEKLRIMVAEVVNLGKGRTSNIKLIKDSKGEARFPGFFTAVNRDSKAYIRNNFIGNKIAFTAYESTKIKNESTAKITPAANLDFAAELPTTSNLDLSFEIGNL